MQYLIVISNNTFYQGCATYLGPFPSKGEAEQELTKAGWGKILENEVEIPGLEKLQSYFWKKKGIRGRARVEYFSKNIQDYESEKYNRSRKQKATV